MDDLNTPLGLQKKAPRRRLRLPFSFPQALAAALALVLIAFAAVAIFNTNPFGGEPSARLAIDPALTANSAAKPGSKAGATPDKAAAAPSSPATANSAAPAGNNKTITIIDGSSGQRREVIVPRAAEPVESPPAGGDNSLLEPSSHGPLPRISTAGLRPSKAYAAGTDADMARIATTPSIAIVVTGLGVGTAKTTDAIIKLPGAVTLAFVPYGTDLNAQIARARAAGHEVMLQIPMEPVDYPDNDPGPQTLLASLPAEQNLSRLHFHMSRIQGYVGLANFMGARFVTAEAGLQVVMREAAKRGLIYLDDASAARSVSRQVAETNAAPFAAADLAIDAVPTAAEIDRALVKLEGLARQRGGAIGIASGLPASIERIAAWARTLESRGLTLAPLTAALPKAKSS